MSLLHDHRVTIYGKTRNISKRWQSSLLTRQEKKKTRCSCITRIVVEDHPDSGVQGSAISLIFAGVSNLSNFASFAACTRFNKFSWTLECLINKPERNLNNYVTRSLFSLNFINNLNGSANALTWVQNYIFSEHVYGLANLRTLLCPSLWKEWMS